MKRDILFKFCVHNTKAQLLMLALCYPISEILRNVTVITEFL